jgi:hypothetical protein
MSERRESFRMSTGLRIDEIVEEEPRSAVATDMSATGLYLEHLAGAGAPMRRSGVVQIEVPLPEWGDSIWAKGAIVYHRRTQLVHGSAVRFLDMARGHRRALRDWIGEMRERSARMSAWGFRERRRPGNLRAAFG